MARPEMGAAPNGVGIENRSAGDSAAAWCCWTATGNQPGVTDERCRGGGKLIGRWRVVPSHMISMWLACLHPWTDPYGSGRAWDCWTKFWTRTTLGNDLGRRMGAHFGMSTPKGHSWGRRWRCLKSPAVQNGATHWSRWDCSTATLVSVVSRVFRNRIFRSLFSYLICSLRDHFSGNQILPPVSPLSCSSIAGSERCD
jgi:hypothetical protein